MVLLVDPVVEEERMLVVDGPLYVCERVEAGGMLLREPQQRQTNTLLERAEREK